MTVKLRDEDGQALLLALAFLVFFGLVIAAILSFAEGGVLATERLREQRATAYAADGATDGAIQYARVNPAAGAFGAVPCITFSTTLNGLTATVTCVSLATPENRDRTVRFTTSVDGTPRVVATVLYHDSATGSCTQQPCIDVLSWTYSR